VLLEAVSQKHSVIRLYSNILPPPNLFGPSQILGLATLLVTCKTMVLKHCSKSGMQLPSIFVRLLAVFQ